MFRFLGQDFTVINHSSVEWLPGIPVHNPDETLDSRDLRKALWAVNRAPEMAYMLRRSHEVDRFFARLRVDHHNPPITQISGWWVVEARVCDRWSQLEDALLYTCNILFQKTRPLTEAHFPPDSHWPLPRRMGYLNCHHTPEAAHRGLLKSRDALLLLAARCSLAIALTTLLPDSTPSSRSPPHWQKILMDAGVSYTWIDELSQSLIADLSPGLRVGAFINPSGFTEWVNHVPCMIRANLPVYVYWPRVKEEDHWKSWERIVSNHPFLRPYRPYTDNAPDVPVSKIECLHQDHRGRTRIVNPQNSFRWEEISTESSSGSSTPGPGMDEAPVESAPHGQGQRPGESFKDFQDRRATQAAEWARVETQSKKAQRLTRDSVAAKFSRPTRHSHTQVYLWTTVGDVDPTVHWSLLSLPYRTLVGHRKTGEVWEQYPNNSKHYDAWRNEWDIYGEMLEGARDEAELWSYSSLSLDDDHCSTPQPSRRADSTTQPSTSADSVSSELRQLYETNSEDEGYEPYLERTVDIFFYRYGILEELSTSGDQERSSVYTINHAETIQKYFGLTLGGARDFPQRTVSAFIAILTGQTDHDDTAPLVWDLDRRSSRHLALPKCRNELLDITKWGIQDPLCYAVRYTGEDPCWFEVLVDATTAVELIRRRNLSCRPSAVSFLAQRGIPFRTMYDPYPELPPPGVIRMFSDDGCIGWRLPSFKASKLDYRWYEERAHELLSTPRVQRAAILCGGIVWRLALEILGEDVLEKVREGPSSDIQLHGEVRTQHGRTYCSDSLTNQEIDIICGTYKIAGTCNSLPCPLTGTDISTESGHKDPVYFSWWPRPPQWGHSGMNAGYWTQFCEEWFKKRLHAVRTSQEEPYSGGTWRNKIMCFKGSRKMRLAVADASDKFLRDVLQVPLVTG